VKVDGLDEERPRLETKDTGLDEERPTLETMGTLG